MDLAWTYETGVDLERFTVVLRGLLRDLVDGAAAAAAGHLAFFEEVLFRSEERRTQR
jgi:hypothetical protein